MREIPCERVGNSGSRKAKSACELAMTPRRSGLTHSYSHTLILSLPLQAPRATHESWATRSWARWKRSTRTDLTILGARRLSAAAWRQRPPSSGCRPGWRRPGRGPAPRRRARPRGPPASSTHNPSQQSGPRNRDGLGNVRVRWSLTEFIVSARETDRWDPRPCISLAPTQTP